MSEDWNNRMKGIVVGLTALIPEVGGPASFVIDLMWPENSPDIFESIKNDVDTLIKKEILNHELSNRRLDIKALKNTMQRYVEAKHHEKGSWLANWINDADKLSEVLRNLPDNVNFIQLMIVVAVLHLTALRERLIYGEKLYDEYNPTWKKDLVEMYKTYVKDYFPTIFKEWKVWRENQVKINFWDTTTMPMIAMGYGSTRGIIFDYHATLVDDVTGQKLEFQQEHRMNNDKSQFSRRVEDVKRRICNDAFGKMVGAISTTFLFAKAFLPDYSPELLVYNKDVFGTLFLGPYFTDFSRFPDFRGDAIMGPTFPDKDDYSTEMGPLTKVIIQEGSAIDAIQFIYARHVGVLGGNPTGGTRHEIDLDGKDVKGFDLGFADGVLIKIRIYYTDGGISPWYGNCRLRSIDYFGVLGPEGYRVSSWSFATNSRSDIVCPSAIQFQYESLYPTEITWKRDSSDWTSALLKQAEKSCEDTPTI